MEEQEQTGEMLRKICTMDNLTNSKENIMKQLDDASEATPSTGLAAKSIGMSPVVIARSAKAGKIQAIRTPGLRGNYHFKDTVVQHFVDS